MLLEAEKARCRAAAAAAASGAANGVGRGQAASGQEAGPAGVLLPDICPLDFLSGLVPGGAGGGQ
jgi:hypothetical protein